MLPKAPRGSQMPFVVIVATVFAVVVVVAIAAVLANTGISKEESTLKSGSGVCEIK